MPKYHVKYSYTNADSVVIEGGALIDSELVSEAGNVCKRDISALIGKDTDEITISSISTSDDSGNVGYEVWNNILIEEEPAAIEEEVVIESDGAQPKKKAWARIENNKVMELTSTDPEGKLHPDIKWVPVPDIFFFWIDNTYVLKKVKKSETIVPPSTEHFLKQLKIQVSIARKHYQSKGITYNGVFFDTDTASKSNILDAIEEGTEVEDNGDIFIKSWKTGGVFHDLSLDDFKAVLTNIKEHIKQCFDREREIIEALPDILMEDKWEEAITFLNQEINTGWPSYEEVENT